MLRARDAIETISAPASAWIWPLVIAATQFWLGTAALTGDHPIGAGYGWLALCVGVTLTAQALALGTRRTYVTTDAVVVRAGLRQRTIAWPDVQAIGVRRRRWLHDQVLEITPTSGEPVVARVSTGWRDGAFERDRRSLEQRWRRQVGPGHAPARTGTTARPPWNGDARDAPTDSPGAGA